MDISVFTSWIKVSIHLSKNKKSWTSFLSNTNMELYGESTSCFHKFEVIFRSRPYEGHDIMSFLKHIQLSQGQGHLTPYRLKVTTYFLWDGIFVDESRILVVTRCSPLLPDDVEDGGDDTGHDDDNRDNDQRHLPSLHLLATLTWNTDVGI